MAIYTKYLHYPKFPAIRCIFILIKLYINLFKINCIRALVITNKLQSLNFVFYRSWSLGGPHWLGPMHCRRKRKRHGVSYLCPPLSLARKVGRKMVNPFS